MDCRYRAGRPNIAGMPVIATDCDGGYTFLEPIGEIDEKANEPEPPVRYWDWETFHWALKEQMTPVRLCKVAAIASTVAAASFICIAISKTSTPQDPEANNPLDVSNTWAKEGRFLQTSWPRRPNKNLVRVTCLNQISNIPPHARQLQFYGENCSSPLVIDERFFVNAQIQDISILGAYNPSVLIQALHGFSKNLLSLTIDVDEFCGNTTTSGINSFLYLPSLVRLTLTNAKKCGLSRMGLEFHVPQMRNLRLQNSVLNNQDSFSFKKILESAQQKIERVLSSNTEFPSHFELSPGQFPKLQIIDIPFPPTRKD